MELYIKNSEIYINDLCLFFVIVEDFAIFSGLIDLFDMMNYRFVINKIFGKV
jgi:hypothetical protein